MSWKTPKYTLIQPEQFKHGFSVDALLSSLSSHDAVSRGKNSKQVVTEGPAILASTKASLEKVERILKNLDRCGVAGWCSGCAPPRACRRPAGRAGKP